ncbi:MAG: heavy-metal-associated domain-containing protein, partial [Bacteroidota bacterium]
FQTQWVYIADIVIMGFGALGVIQSVVDKRKIRCACLGSVFNLPMSTVTIVENSLMVLIGIVLLNL